MMKEYIKVHHSLYLTTYFHVKTIIVLSFGYNLVRLLLDHALFKILHFFFFFSYTFSFEDVFKRSQKQGIKVVEG